MTEDPEAFRQRVIKLAQELYPNLTLAEHPEAIDVVLADEQQVSLQNIRANYNLSERPDDDLRSLVERHFGQLLSPAIPKIEDLTYESIQDKLYPQVMPAEYVESAPLRLISFPLSNEVSVGLVADFPETYMYLREVDLQRWDVAADDLFDQAQKNLEELTQSVQLQLAGADKDVFVAVASGDGYDAVRILMPTFQAFLAQHLGETFRFAIPNRDFLICWRLDCEDSFHQQISSQIIADSSERPYPLSSSVFVRNSEGNIHEQIPMNITPPPKDDQSSPSD